MTVKAPSTRVIARVGVVDIRAILFDFNGVILDDEHMHYELMAGQTAGDGIALTRALYDSRYVGYDDHDAFMHIYRDGGKPRTEEELNRMIDLKAKRYMATVAQRASIFPGWPEFVREAAPFFRLGICTGALRPEVDRVLDETSTRDLIPHVVSAEEVSVGKPDPEGYRELCRRISVAAIEAGDPPVVPAQCLVIEDTVWGVRAARAAGMWVCGFDGPLANEEFARLSHATIKGWRDADPFDLVATIEQGATGQEAETA